jgi:hypothetical protein
MPSKSPAQARLMAAAAHNPRFAAAAGVPPQVAREFNQADATSGKLSQALRAHQRKTPHKEM